jgi:hypothetical protein
MKPTDYDMIKLALNSVDLVILRSLVQQAMKRTPDADWQRLDLLTRARDLLAEFYQGNGHGRESLASRERGPALNLLPASCPRASTGEASAPYGACSDHFSRITPRRRFLSGRTK